MTDLLGVYILVVIVPLLLLAAISAVCVFAFSALTGKRSNYLNLLKAIGPSLLVAIFFPVAFSLTVGWLLGPVLGPGYAIVMLQLTAFVTLACYVYFAKNGTSKLLSIRKFRERYKKSVGPNP